MHREHKAAMLSFAQKCLKTVKQGIHSFAVENILLFLRVLVVPTIESRVNEDFLKKYFIESKE
ncbi:MAG: hypothetical protein V4607_02440 [Pseudomonadota bacterium]